MDTTLQFELTPEDVGVKTIPADSLIPNPHNPRVLFDRRPMDVLEDSIRKVGILVPLTVYWGTVEKAYVILDGQRRWMCAQKVGLEEIPVNQVAEPTLVGNIVVMFQIHKFREDWELMPTALKLEVLMSELKEKRDKALAELTGLDQAVVVRCKKLLSYPKRYQDMMLDFDPDARLKADFFIELYAVIHDRLIPKMQWYKRNEFIDRMLKKYAGKKGLKSVTDFRVIKQHLTNAKRANKISAISRRLQEFTFDDTLTLDHLAINAASVSATARRVLKEVIKLETSLSELNAEQFYGEEDLWESLERIRKIIDKKLRAAGRRSAA